MQHSVFRYTNAFLQYPFTWGAFLILALFHSGFAWWFSPSPFMHVLAAVLDVGCFIFFVAITRRSTAFIDFYEQRNYQVAIKAVASSLPDGTEAFRVAALACLTLSQQLHRDFKDEPSMHEFEEFLQNLTTMADNHRRLYGRFQQFGTAEQKDKMQVLLARQLHTMQQTLENLQAFSGNLTIMSAQFEKSALAARELQFLNQGLQEVMREMSDA